MASSMKSAALAANKAQRSAAGEAITYKRGVNSVSLTAVIGTSGFDQVDAMGIVERIESRDYFIEAAKLIIDSALILPGIGDSILETVDGVTYTYEVMTLDGQPAWRYSDPYRDKLRIHTKQIVIS